MKALKEEKYSGRDYCYLLVRDYCYLLVIDTLFARTDSYHFEALFTDSLSNSLVMQLEQKNKITSSEYENAKEAHSNDEKKSSFSFSQPSPASFFQPVDGADNNNQNHKNLKEEESDEFTTKVEMK